jgi:hypothetical protein
MKITLGMIVVLASMVLFYLRIAILRGQKKRYEREYALKRRKVSGRSKGAALPTPEPGSPPFGVSSWPLVVLSFLIILAGVIMYSEMNVFGVTLFEGSALVEKLIPYWYIPMAAGVILMAFCLKIEKPKLDNE